MVIGYYTGKGVKVIEFAGKVIVEIDLPGQIPDNSHPSKSHRKHGL